MLGIDAAPERRLGSVAPSVLIIRLVATGAIRQMT